MSILPITQLSRRKGYRIERSLRFNSADSAYLSRTPSVAGNRRTWTWSGWVKRSTTSGAYEILFGCGTGNAVNTNWLGFIDGNGLGYSINDGVYWVTTSQVFRDTSSWYHIILATDTTQATASNRIKLYVNGIQITSFSNAIYPSQNYDQTIGSTNFTTIGARYRTSIDSLFPGYMTEVNFIDGQALTPTSFGEFDSVTGVWKPKKYTGTYGTNGFYLNFSDNSNTTATTLGKDSSGNNNNWTPNNFSVTAGAGNDSMVDTPTPYGTDTGVGGQVRGNYCTLNPLDKDSGLTLSNGNLDLVGANAGGASTFGITSGKWYWEVTITDSHSSKYWGIFGLSNGRASLYASGITGYPVGAGVYACEPTADGGTYSNGSRVTTQTTWANNDVIGFAFDAGAMTLDVYRNNSKIGTTLTVPSGAIYPSFYHNGIVGDTSASTANFGQRPFAYTAPSGFKALCTTNLPEPTIKKGSNHFNTLLWTGGDTSTSRSITGLNFKPDLVVIKSRSAAYTHSIFDSVRGAGAKKALYFDVGTEAQGESNVYGFLSSFDDTGFTGTRGSAGSSSNPDGYAYYDELNNAYVAWNWKGGGTAVTNTQGTITSQVSANPSAGFSIITYTGNGVAGATVGHGLGVSPNMVIIKNRSDSIGRSWIVFTSMVTTQSSGSVFTSSVFNIGSKSGGVLSCNLTNGSFSYVMDARTNANTDTYVAYCFAEIPGYSAFGSYTGNGSTDGPFVYLGFRPRFILLKVTNTTGNWTILDTAREGYNVDNDPLYPNLSDAEGTTDLLDILSNGFKLRTTDASVNGNTNTYIYAAFAENPFKYSLAR